MHTPNTKNYKEQILDFIKENYEVAPIEIITKTGISQQTVHNNLKRLLAAELIVKKGSGLDVVYSVNENINSINLESIGSMFSNFADTITQTSQKLNQLINSILFDNSKILKPDYSTEEYGRSIEFINNNYLYISPDGHVFGGDQGLVEWADRLNPNITFLEYTKLRFEYIETAKKYQKYFDSNNLIDATNKFKITFPNYKDIEKVFYCDFYAIERFGKTKLGNLMFYGKQTQNKYLIEQVCNIVKPRILEFIKQNNISAVAFVPPTIQRETQFMSELKSNLNLNIPIIKLKKLVNEIAVPQKTIKNANDRVLNAENIVVEMNPSFQNVLILDDAVGSGSTFAVVAKKLRRRNVATGKIFALAIVGSPNGVIDDSKKGFEIVNEV
jgi:phosphoribosylpyrophosphate synthetase/DNA-binding transcriptional ArsR family regulator